MNEIKRYINSRGQYHRDDGPAIEWPNGNKFWWKKGKRHREDGPAEEWLDEEKYWWLLDLELKENEFNSWILRLQKCI